MNRKCSESKGYGYSPGSENRERLEYAQLSIQAMALEAMSHRSSGTISVEIPVKKGKLGRVKRLRIEFQSE